MRRHLYWRRLRKRIKQRQRWYGYAGDACRTEVDTDAYTDAYSHAESSRPASSAVFIHWSYGHGYSTDAYAHVYASADAYAYPRDTFSTNISAYPRVYSRADA